METESSEHPSEAVLGEYVNANTPDKRDAFEQANPGVISHIGGCDPCKSAVSTFYQPLIDFIQDE